LISFRSINARQPYNYVLPTGVPNSKGVAITNAHYLSKNSLSLSNLTKNHWGNHWFVLFGRVFVMQILLLLWGKFHRNLKQSAPIRRKLRETSELKQNPALAATLLEKLTPNAAKILSQFRATRKK
jgi:hypothetical protein